MTHATYSGRMVIIGPPGTGKTRRVSQSVSKIVRELPIERHGLPAMVCSLTNAAATEAAGRIEDLPDGAVGTLHSMAYRALDRPPLTEPQLKKFNAEYPDMAIAVRGGRLEDPFGDVADDNRNTPGERWSQEYHRLRNCMIDPNRSPLIRVRRFAKVWEEWKAANELLDFTDLIQEAAKRTLSAPGQPNVILADEAQDHSKLEMSLLNHWANSAMALIIVGDPWQSLYQWRGADPSLFHVERADRRDVLGQSYRVPVAVHRAAVNWVSALSDYEPIEYLPRPEEGAVAPVRASYDSPHQMIAQAKEYVAAGMSVMIAASCGYMLDPTVTALRQAGMPFSNPWRRTNGRWNPLTRRAGGVTMADRVRALLVPITGIQSDVDTDDASFNFGGNVEHRTHWTCQELFWFADLMDSASCLNRGAKAALKELAAKCPTLPANPQHVICEHFRADVADRLIRLQELSAADAVQWFTGTVLDTKRKTLTYPANVVRRSGVDALSQRPKLHVGTIHSFKGAEADVVFLVPDLSTRGAQQWSYGPTGRDPIIRMFYVGITRARERVHVCEPAGTQAVSLWKGMTRNGT